ncbi:hypothetical protein H3Z83_08110 [Tenacibaculum sp. S7007]|uniref:Uncharacterized protein n=1 Tax=Tenacibaculum pelagium TaxID=2759527 RepID=A0A839AN10_9FLAO|nr:hypothetical protein [Tenacibaculum pelagium]MBA6156473.1 hypothetical protein [Tenacibaculum pelagium]
MRKNKAISILENQIKKLGKKENLNHRWTIETRTYLKEFFGEDSEQLQFLKDFNWKPGIASEPEIYKPTIEKFLYDCISTIKNIGLKKEVTENWFSKIPNWIMSLSLTGLFGLGIVIGNVTNDKQNFELRQENKVLKRELLNKTEDTLSIKNEKTR